MNLERNQAHEPDGLLKLAPPFWGKPRIASLLLGYLAEVQVLEDAIWSLIDGIDIDSCERYALDGFAQIVGESARPEDTEVLRTLVRGRIAANRSDGTLPAIRAVVDCLTSEATACLDGFDCLRILQITGVLDAPDACAALLADSRPGGVTSCWIYPAGATACAFPDVDNSDPDDARAVGEGVWSGYYG
jgi:hypothetical protein